MSSSKKRPTSGTQSATARGKHHQDAPTAIKPDPDRSCPCDPRTDSCGCLGHVRMADCRCYRYIFDHHDLWGGWPYKNEQSAFVKPGEPVDLAKARALSAAVVAEYVAAVA